MPEYLAPGVYVEETTFRQKTIEGVSSSTSGFVGATRFGPLDGEPALLTSFNEFERIYGGIDQLDFEDVTTGSSHNYMAHGVRAYFEEGGRRLYVARTFNELRADPNVDPQLISGNWDDGIAREAVQASPDIGLLNLRARYPGDAGNFRVTFVLRAGENVSGEEPVDLNDPLGPTTPILRGVSNFAVVMGRSGSPLGAPTFYWAEIYFDTGLQRETHRLWPSSENTNQTPGNAVALANVDDARVITVSVLVEDLGQFVDPLAWENLHPDARRRPRESLMRVFAPPPETPTDAPLSRSTELFVPLVIESELGNGAAIVELLAAQTNLLNASVPQSVEDGLSDANSSDTERSFRTQLEGGNDGNLPAPVDFEGDEGADGRKSGLRAFEDLEEISILAAPGHTHSDNDDADASAVTRLLISHCERMRYRIAVLDSINGQTLGEVRDWRSTLDSTRAALYYPWVKILDPVTEDEIDLPPSGFTSGIYARNDIERGVHKSPANEVVRLAQSFEVLINRAQQDVLNPEGINCMRFFEGRGFRVWGARTATSDPEWKYVNVRRFFMFLERSIEKGTQWAVFENNGPVLWANIRRTVEDFLFNEWKSNHLFGTTPEEAFFVRCDRSTMTQNDLDNGRLICLIGVAPLRPAEFVIFRIGQKTADATQ